VSTDVRAVAVFDAAGALVASGPGSPGDDASEAVAGLWEAAERAAASLGTAPLDHVVVPASGGGVAVVAAGGHRIAAVTERRPAVALLLFDLRTCLGDAYAAADEVPS
jgi:predicted regulator of Ras-like GTPase activity (Roadblock/LC7/MglB family)